MKKLLLTLMCIPLTMMYVNGQNEKPIKNQDVVPLEDKQQKNIEETSSRFYKEGRLLVEFTQNKQTPGISRKEMKVYLLNTNDEPVMQVPDAMLPATLEKKSSSHK